MDENKPLNLTLFEFKQRIKTIIQDSRLPGYLLEPIFKEIYGDCVNASQRELEEARKNYKQKINSTDLIEE